MSFRRSKTLSAFLLSSLPLFVGCSSSDETPAGNGGAGGSGASGGSAGTLGGTAGSGASGSAGTGGSSGSGAGTAGAAGGGQGGTAGAAAGSAGTSGSAGSTSGAAGSMGGTGAAGAAGAGAGGLAGDAGSAGAASAGAGAGGMAGDAGTSGSAGNGGSSGGGAFTLTNPDFVSMPGCAADTATSCDVFPRELASYMSGPNVSPELDWTGVPAGTQSFAVILQDLTNGFAHWVLWNIPGNATMLAADVDKSTTTPAVPAGSEQRNLSQGDGYFGPGSACNVYEFVLYALATADFMPTAATDANSVRTQLDALDSTALLGKASLRGRQNYNNQCN